MKIKAFTLAEAIVMIGILGVITAVALPTLIKKDFKTDTNIRAAAKAYSTLAQVVSNVIQDGFYYKHFDVHGLADNTEGIDVLTGEKYDGSAPEKFRDILMDTLYVSNPVSSDDSSYDYYQFDTPDGIRWKLRWDGDTFKDLQNPMVVYVDTNIKNGNDFKCNKPSKCRTVDSLAFVVHRNGNVLIDGTDTNMTTFVKENSVGYNDREFVKKVLGQHENTENESSFYP